MTTYSVQKESDRTTIVNKPKWAKFPIANILLVVIYIVVSNLALYASMVPVLLPLNLIISAVLALGVLFVPIVWFMYSVKSRGKGTTQIIADSDRLIVNIGPRKLLEVDRKDISSFRVGNTMEDYTPNLIQTYLGYHKFSEHMFNITLVANGKKTIIAWGMDEASAEGVLHEIR